MSDLISREAAINTIKNHYCDGCTYYDVKCKSVLSGNCPIFNVISTIGIMPAVDAEPVQRGVWEWYEEWWHGECDEYGWRCSVCGVSLADSIEEAIGERPDLDDPDKVPTMKRCPNCEAKMDLEDDDE